MCVSRDVVFVAGEIFAACSLHFLTLTIVRSLIADVVRIVAFDSVRLRIVFGL